ncbi:MAG: Tim44 domain-containing protein [Ottowia sp.]|jgi:predicted lipid-binding transport protein (Tim44 family)|uniref:Tim44 domain-containing protein n=1 Tax=Ottowia beijingensis TaxID=1207057 RepID=A0A853IXQ6_9BURK|nr:TIM44-like domain-containing protein [Ottowia beijingensis]MBP6780204.1 Tim44 domain-containing protein [Ottowia sp.]MBP7532060.1 Tim44 domain-containing protein [Ottowia sp.]MBP7536208.1 Tim44 domain-containing protein [Ottowia sp.]MBP9953460.1 Tim44 domain-containing protein [Ottowia sp.]NZA02540.1 Tim44 domain-containing protein [Ottowia beijingensis]
MKLSHIASRLFTLLLAVVLVGVFTFDAEARRLGGGKSMGRQSSNVTQRQATPPAAAPGNPSQSAATAGAAGAGTAAAGAAARKPWGAMVGGLAAGLGLAWLAHSLGLGPAFANFLLFMLLGVVILAVIGMIRRSRAGAQGQGLAYQGAGAANPVTPRQYNPTKVGNDASARPWEGQAAQFDAGAAGAAGGSMIGSALSGSQSWGVPADFDIAGFTEAAKRNFITLQDAWDRSDIPALRAMMTDDMLTEIQSQLAERERTATPGQVNKTDVVMLEAQLLGIEELDDAYMASVEFSGMIREEPSAGPSPFREVWNMTKPRSGRGGWLVAGVQALQ